MNINWYFVFIGVFQHTRNRFGCGGFNHRDGDFLRIQIGVSCVLPIADPIENFSRRILLANDFLKIRDNFFSDIIMSLQWFNSLYVVSEKIGQTFYENINLLTLISLNLRFN